MKAMSRIKNTLDLENLLVKSAQDSEEFSEEYFELVMEYAEERNPLTDVEAKRISQECLPFRV
jgi:hypothetical protein